MQILLIVAAALMAVLLATLGRSWLKRQLSRAKQSSEILFANIAEGVHEEFISRLPDAAIGSYFLLAKKGSDNLHADVAGAADIPVGVWQDTTGTAGDLTIPLAIGLLGASETTRKVAINSAVAEGDFLVPDANGFAKTLPAVTGTYYIIGRALQGGAAGDAIEFDPTVPIQRVVA